MDYDSRNSFEFFLSVDSSKLVPSKERTGQFPKRRIVQFSRLYKTTEAKSWALAHIPKKFTKDQVVYL